MTSSFIFPISIAGIALQLSINDLIPTVEKKLHDQYGDFLESNLDPKILVDINIEPGGIFLPFTSTNLQIDTNLDSGYLTYKSHYEAGWLDFRSGRGNLLMRPEGNFENYLRVVYAWLCLDHEALMLHASGMIRKGFGYVFFGPSGSGKTTIAQLSSDAQILSDDLVILKLENDKSRSIVKVYGVPFRGESLAGVGSNSSTSEELRRLFFLNQSLSHKICPLNHVLAVAHLSASVPFVMSDLDGIKRTLTLCEEISNRVAVATLQFKKDSEFWKLIDEKSTSDP
jgi:hypothetical protein